MLKRIFILFLVFIIIISQPYYARAQADLRYDNYIQVKNNWEDTARLTKSIQLKVLKKYGLDKYGLDSIPFKWLPIVHKLQYVQDHPYNWNDGAMVQAKGWQQFTRLGIYAKWKNFEAQIAPEFVYAENKIFEDFPETLDGVHWKDYYRFYNFIELPTRMGDRTYARLLYGQTFIKFHHKNFVLAASTENKWWGPMQRNSLLLSTTGAGFPHVSFATEKPIETKIGSFEVEILYGNLVNGGWLPPDTAKKFIGNSLYVPKIPMERYIMGVNLSYHPKWVPHLSLGFEQMYVQYRKYLKNWDDYLPVKNLINRFSDERIKQPILLTALNFNYSFPEVNAAIYGEWGWNLTQTSFRNWLLQSDKGMASSLGFKKLFISDKKQYWELIGEITQLQLLTQADRLNLDLPASWYLGSNVRQGYTNDGQLLGAGVGPGGSSQLLELNWRKNINRIGLTVERRVHNNDFYEFTFVESKDFRRFYVDFSSTIKVDWKYKKWLFGPRLSYIMTNNYNWWLFQANDIYFVNGKDVQQFALQFNFKYQL